MLKKIAIILAPVLLLVAGCTKDPKQVLPTNLYSLNNYPANVDGLNSVLATGYSALRDANFFGFNYLPKAMANATHVADDGGYDAGWTEMCLTNFSISNSYSLGAWQTCYAGIKNCNTTLQAADVYMSKYGVPADLSAVNLIRGQAHVLRAYYYMTLECLFGEDNVPNKGPKDTLGVPIDTVVPTSLAASQAGRSSIKTVWSFIESDLTQAIALLHGQVWVGNDVGRASEWAAKGLLGKAYIFTKDYANAKTVLLDVINNSGKSLMAYDKYRNAFIGISANEFNEESLLELNIDFAANGQYGIYGPNPNSTSLNTLIWSPFVLGDDGTETGSIALGYGNEVIHDQNIKRFGYPLGPYTLVNNPGYNAVAGPSASNPKQIMDPVYKTTSLAVRANKTADPRLYVNALQPWLDSAINIPPAGYVAGTVPTTGFRPVSKPNGPAKPTTYQWSFRKYAAIYCGVNYVPGGQADGANIYLLRLADVYLLYAEACINTNDGVTGLEYLNRVKRRAYGLPVTAPSAIDYPSLTSPTAAAAAGDPVLGSNPLYYERWAELFNEGHWWFDICRWHLGQSEAAFYVSDLAGPLSWKDKSYTWPIPLLEINANAKIAGQQNPGY
jgi:hypothetical protein